MSSLVCRLSRRVSLDFQTLGHFFSYVFVISLCLFPLPSEDKSSRARYSKTCRDYLEGPTQATGQMVCEHLGSPYPVVPRILLSVVLPFVEGVKVPWWLRIYSLFQLRQVWFHLVGEERNWQWFCLSAEWVCCYETSVFISRKASCLEVYGVGC